MSVSGKIFLVIALLTTFKVCFAGEITVLSDRTGKEIDLFERNYFLLFPEIDDFYTARLSKNEDGSYEFIVSRKQNGNVLPDTIISAVEDAIANLKIYIDNYEKIMIYHDSEKYPGLVKQIGLEPDPISKYIHFTQMIQEPVKLFFITRENDTVYAKLMLATSDYLAILRYDTWDMDIVKDSLMVFHYSEIGHIGYNGEIEVAGNRGIYDLLLKSLREKDAFIYANDTMFYAPEILTRINEKKKNFVPSEMPVPDFETLYDNTHKKFAVKPVIYLYLNANQKEYLLKTKGAKDYSLRLTESDVQENFPVLQAGTEFLYKFMDILGLGGGIFYFGAVDPHSGENGISMDLFLKLDLRPFVYYSLDALAETELSVSAGYSYYRNLSDININYRLNPESVYRGLVIRRYDYSGYFFRLGLTQYLSPSFAVSLNALYRFFPYDTEVKNINLNIPETKLTYDFRILNNKFDSFGLGIGVSYFLD